MQPRRRTVALVTLAALAGCVRPVAPEASPEASPVASPKTNAGAGDVHRTGLAGEARSCGGRRPLQILRDWDAARARAWESVDAAALGALYVSGSSAGIRDVRGLVAYADRGLRVTGLRMQRLTARVLVCRSALIRIEVVERFAGASVEDGVRGRRLPTGVPTRRVVELRYVEGAWRMSQVQVATR